jgi:flagellar hook assembly protein FlgD
MLLPSGSVTSVLPDDGTADGNSNPNDSCVLILLGEDAPLGPLGQNYTITVRNVVAQSGNRITKGAGNTIGFTFSANSLDDIFAYPNPVNFASTEEVMFANITQDAEITVYAVDGTIIANIEETDGNGGVLWNCRDNKGKLISSGVYYFSVTGTDSNGQSFTSELKKFAVIR